MGGDGGHLVTLSFPPQNKKKGKKEPTLQSTLYGVHSEVVVLFTIRLHPEDHSLSLGTNKLDEAGRSTNATCTVSVSTPKQVHCIEEKKWT